jgi:hypothetical protein
VLKLIYLGLVCIEETSNFLTHVLSYARAIVVRLNGTIACRIVHSTLCSNYLLKFELYSSYCASFREIDFEVMNAPDPIDCRRFIR